jgi:hypothetical protein
MNTEQLLRDATVQDIQLELLRRTQHNLLDGEKVVATLLKHRDLWVAALLDRPGFTNRREPGQLLAMSLIKLRDLPHNDWNADTLFLLSDGNEKAIRLASVIEQSDWCGEVSVHNDREEIDRALGVGGVNYGLVSVWWD